MIIVHLSHTAALHTGAIASWITEVVSESFPVADAAHPHVAVVGTLHSDYRDPVASDPRNELVVAIHQSNSDDSASSYFRNSTYENSVVTREKNLPRPLFSAAVASDALSIDGRIPAVVEHVGTSAISRDFMKQVWTEIISVNREYMEGSGGGYMQHRMYMWTEQNGVHDVAEQSYNFGWD